MREFLFHATLLASIRVKAETQAEAELKLREALSASDANLDERKQFGFRRANPSVNGGVKVGHSGP